MWKKGFLGVLFSGSVLLAGFWITAASAATFMRPYALPEVLHADNFRQSVYVPRKTNVNTAPLAELMSLPGIDMNIALKLIRVRPVSSLEDIERKMPTLTPSSIQQLIQYLDPKVLIK